MTDDINTWVYMMIDYNFMHDFELKYNSLVRFSFRTRGIILSSELVTGKSYLDPNVLMEVLMEGLQKRFKLNCLKLMLSSCFFVHPSLSSL